MALLGDHNELKAAWKSLSLPYKIFFSCSFALSCFSLASIGDAVFQFKGFIFEGIKFYQLLSGKLLLHLQTILNVSIDQIYFDAATISVFTAVSFSKSTSGLVSDTDSFLRPKVLKKFTKHKSKLIYNLYCINSVTSLWLIPISFHFLLFYMFNTISIGQFGIDFKFAERILIFAFITPLSFYISHKFTHFQYAVFKKGQKLNSKITKSDKKYFSLRATAYLNTALYMCSIYFVVAVIASVSEGLTR